MQEVETVEQCCEHEDCIYRRYLGTHIPYCDYIGVEKKPRGCEISRCDKYKPGRKTQPRMQWSYKLDWEWESFIHADILYEEGD